MSEADDIREFMGLVGKDHERAAQEDMAELMRKLEAEWANHPDWTVVRRRTFDPETGLFGSVIAIERKSAITLERKI